MSLPRRGLAPLIAAASLGRAKAQETAWPSRPLPAIVAFPAGSGTDSLARFYADRLGRVLGQPVTVDNMGGANGAIATRAAARAAPDGYTLFLGPGSSDPCRQPEPAARARLRPHRGFRPGLAHLGQCPGAAGAGGFPGEGPGGLPGRGPRPAGPAQPRHRQCRRHRRGPSAGRGHRHPH